ncbi:MAG: Bax inhibitor-1/YccA family protein [Prevotella sp.]|nr:Bax inhibitor-1/YccA family protein [Prevotella sp.]
MDNRNFTEVIREREFESSLAFPALMRKVYLWMSLALVLTGMTAYGVASSPGLLQAIIGNRILFFGLIIGELALVMIVSGMINRLSLTTATLLFVLYSVINGATLSVIFLAYTMESITQVFFITAGTFAGMSAVGYLTKRDLSTVGRILNMTLIGLIIATIVNVFWQNSGFMVILNYLGVLVFVGLTAYDTQKIKDMLMMAESADEIGQKMALMGALILYLDFINLFLYLLRIFGKSRD